MACETGRQHRRHSSAYRRHREQDTRQRDVSSAIFAVSLVSLLSLLVFAAVGPQGLQVGHLAHSLLGREKFAEHMQKAKQASFDGIQTLNFRVAQSGPGR